MKIEWAAVTVAVAVCGGLIGYLILEGEKMGAIQAVNQRQDLTIAGLRKDKDVIVKQVIKSSEGLDGLGDRVSRLEGRMDAYHPNQVLVPESIVRPWQRQEPTPGVVTDQRGSR